MGFFTRISGGEDVARIVHARVPTGRAEALAERLRKKVACYTPVSGGVDMYLASGEVTAETEAEFARSVRSADWFARVRTHAGLGREEHVVFVPDSAARLVRALALLLALLLVIGLICGAGVALALARYEDPLDALATRAQPLVHALRGDEL